MISLDEALDLLLDGVAPLPAETALLDDLDGRILAQDIVAAHDQPAEPRSIMDGIALARSEDENRRFRLAGESAAGSPYKPDLESGEAVYVSTGGVVPSGANQVVPKEMIDIDGDAATILEWPSSAFIRLPGADFKAGEVLIGSGSVLGPATIALVAASNHPVAPVVRRPRVAILTGGEELVEPGDTLGAGRSVDSASHGILALARRWGALTIHRPFVGDDRAATVLAMETALEDADLLVTIGGASVGRHDHMRPAARDLGGELPFERIALKPGKPSWHARLPDGKMILGIPGNPTSALVCANLLLRPLLMALTGRDPAMPLVDVPLAAGLAPNGAREQFVRAALTSVGLAPLGDQDSGLQAALARATHLVRQPAHHPGARKADTVSALPLET